MIPGALKVDTVSNPDQTKLHIRTLIEKQLKEMGSAKIIITLWIVWKKPIKLLIDLGPENLEDVQVLNDGIVDNYIRIEVPFNSLMTEFFQGSDINDLIQRMLAHIKTQTENPKFPESGFSLDKIIHLYINFHRLVLTRGSSYIELPE